MTVVERVIEYPAVNGEGDLLTANLVDLNINSITFIKLVIEMEKEFDIEFEDDDLDISRFPTFQGIAQFVAEKLASSRRQL